MNDTRYCQYGKKISYKHSDLCHSCLQKGKHDHNKEKNPFYGKQHSKRTKEKLKNVDRSYTQTQSFKDKSKRDGKKNGMYGKSLYDLWIEKYGKEEADKKHKELCKKRSQNAKGKRNPMYNKPSPISSGNGISGWYKDWFFRSLRELSYVINILEKKGYKWESAERIRIPYVDHTGKHRTYSPDFLVENSILVEIKPKRLKKLWTNKIKRKAARTFCKENGYTYQIIDINRNRLSIDDVITLEKQNVIRLCDRSKLQLTSKKYKKNDLQINEEVELTIKQFFNICKQGGIYQIETPDGWQDINFLVKKKKKKCFKIKTTNNYLGCSNEHLVETETGWKKPEDLKINDEIFTKLGKEKLIETQYIGKKSTYDLQVNSSKHRYFTNNIISHNCGKSRIMESLSNEWNLNYIEFDPSAVYSARVGESEGNMRLTLAAIESQSPIILGIDEIEKGFSGTQSSSFSDAGTVSRTFGIFLMWMQNNLQSVFVSATCNSINLLPPELISRFDEIFYIGPPTVEERADILRIQISERKRNPDKFDIMKLSENCQHLSGREIMQAVKEAMHVAFNVTHTDITDDILLECLQRKTPVVKTMQHQLQYLIKWVGYDEKTKDGIRARFANNEMDEYDKLFQEVLANTTYPENDQSSGGPNSFRQPF